MPVPALAAAGSWLAQHPIVAQLLLDKGYDVYKGLMGGKASPYEQAATQQLGIGKSLIPQLQAAAQGMPTAATRNIQKQLRQQTTSAQQSYAAAATARGGGGTPVAAQQARFRAAETQALGQQLGAAQQVAQTQLTGIYSGGMQAVGALEQRELQAKGQVLGALGDYLAYYREGQRDETDSAVMELWKEMIGFQKEVTRDLLNMRRGGQPLGPAF